jgi:hypothetical protein
MFFVRFQKVQSLKVNEGDNKFLETPDQSLSTKTVAVP